MFGFEYLYTTATAHYTLIFTEIVYFLLCICFIIAKYFLRLIKPVPLSISEFAFPSFWFFSLNQWS